MASVETEIAAGLPHSPAQRPGGAAAFNADASVNIALSTMNHEDAVMIRM
jgi:hypothetical protein